MRTMKPMVVPLMVIVVGLAWLLNTLGVLPEIDWMGLEDAEAAELANVGSLAQPVSKPFWLGLLAVLATIGIVVYLQLV